MTTQTATSLIIHSPAFAQHGHIPPTYTCDGENMNPELHITGIPDVARSLALIVEDPDAPNGTFDHWLVWNILPEKVIYENSVPGIVGKNSFGNMRYSGPCPPSGTHRYFFKLYALDTMLNLPAGADKQTLQDAMQDHILVSGELVGLYNKKEKQ